MNTRVQKSVQRPKSSASQADIYYQQAIKTVTEYIACHIDEPLTLETLATLAGFSPFHFHRIFAAFTGTPLGEYIRHLRLQRAAQRLLDSAENITEVALESGYETPAAFTKAFKSYFYVTPTQLRELERDFARRTVNRLDPITKKRSKQVKSEIQVRPDQAVLYVRRLGAENSNFNRAAKEAFAALWTHLQQNNLLAQVTSCLAITPDEPGVVPEAQCRFDAAVTLRSDFEPVASGEAQVQILPGGRMAVFIHKGPYDTLWLSWRSVYRDWLPSSGEQLRDAAPYEVYIDDPEKTAPEELRTEICIPLQ